MISLDNSKRQIQEICVLKEAEEGDGGENAKERIFAAIGEEGVALAAQAATSLSRSKSWRQKFLVLGSNLFKTDPAFSLVGIRVPLTIWVNFSQQGIRLEKEILFNNWRHFLYQENKKK